jgi:hypothetical protein
MTQVIVTMQNGSIETIDIPTAENESIMRIRIAYLVIGLFPSWQYVSWDWQGELQTLKKGETK